MNFPAMISSADGWLRVGYDGEFSVFRTFDCGQCFRFERTADERFSCRVDGVALGRDVSFAQTEDGELFVRAPQEDFELWAKYLALDEDYGEYDCKILSALDGAAGKHMKRAVAASRGIRLLRQEPWETLCSFIVSQNNNIPRIKKIISQLCREFGECRGGVYLFPTPEALAAAGEEKIFALKTGFRAAYICDAAKKVASGELSLDAVSHAADYEDAAELLETIRGVGAKVAACTLLFGFARKDAFPVDVWMRRVIDKRFNGSLDPAAFGGAAGLAQQYLFYYEKYISDEA